MGHIVDVTVDVAVDVDRVVANPRKEKITIKIEITINQNIEEITHTTGEGLMLTL